MVPFWGSLLDFHHPAPKVTQSMCFQFETLLFCPCLYGFLGQLLWQPREGGGRQTHGELRVSGDAADISGGERQALL